jgi:DNA-binding response OmpR family regulator
MRILIVEDEQKLANAMKRALELQKYAVGVAYDGTTGYDLAIGEAFDLIILDLMLPGIDGVEICKKIREEGLHTPILILTAKSQIDDKITGLDAGADDYMIKPFSFEELFARVRALIRRPQHIDMNILKAKDLTLNTVTYKVKRKNQLIQLSTKEFSILEYLLRNKNIVISREQLISHVWNYDADVLPNVVEVHIKHLRDKVDAPFSTPIIGTVRGKGYIVEDE